MLFLYLNVGIISDNKHQWAFIGTRSLSDSSTTGEEHWETIGNFTDNQAHYIN